VPNAIQQIRPLGGEWVEPDDAEDRKKAWRILHESCRSARFYMDTFWATGIALVEGKHWLETDAASVQRGSSRKVVVYPEQYGSGGEEIRATLNWTRPLATDVASILRVDPNGWALQFDPDGRDLSGSAMDVAVSERVWRDFLHQPAVDISGQDDLKNHWRVQAGSGILKAHPDAHCPYGWNISMVPLDRMFWHGGECNPDPARHRQWADCTAWPVETVERLYGITFTDEMKNALPTLSALQAFDEMLQGIRSVNEQVAGNSQAKALLVTEFYDDWFDRLTMLAHTGSGANQCIVLWDGPNPYRMPDGHGLCPYLKNDFALSLLSPWGVGVSHVVQTPQMVTALVVTNILRHQVTCTANRWLYQTGTIADPETAFSPVVGAPLEFTGNSGKDLLPQMIKPPDISALTKDVLMFMPQFGRDSASVPPVMRGGSSGSREAAEALRTRIAQAERPFSAIEERDLRAYQRFFTQFVRFLVETAPVELFVAACGEELQTAALDMVRRAPRLRHRVIASVPRDAVQPRTANERKREIMEWASLKLMTPDEARYEVAQVTGKPLTSREQQGIINATMEGRAFIEGATADQIHALHWEPHDIHVRTHQQLLTNRHSANLDPSVQQEISLHILDHYEQWGDEQELQGAMMMAAQGQVGAVEAVQGQSFGDEMPNSPAQGSLAAPQPQPSDYQRRETERAAQTA